MKLIANNYTNSNGVAVSEQLFVVPATVQRIIQKDGNNIRTTAKGSTFINFGATIEVNGRSMQAVLAISTKLTDANDFFVKDASGAATTEVNKAFQFEAACKQKMNPKTNVMGIVGGMHLQIGNSPESMSLLAAELKALAAKDPAAVKTDLA